MILLNHTLALTLAATAGADRPVIGYNNLVTSSNIAADGNAGAGYEATNLAIANTASIWRGADTSDQYITITVDSAQEIDYVGVAAHNFGSGAITVSLEGRATSGDSFSELVSERLLSADDPLIFRFTAQSLYQVRVKMQPGSTVPEAAVVYVGTLLAVESGLTQGHAPLPTARRREYTTGVSIAGDFLGRVLLREGRRSTAVFEHMDVTWFYANMVDFLDALGDPFFFAWAPVSRPNDAGFAWAVNDPEPVKSIGTQRFAMTIDMEGIA